METLIAFAIVIGVGWWIYAKAKKKKAFDALRQEDSMKVDITTQSITRGKFTHEMVIDVQFPQKEWAALKQTGTIKEKLFDYPALSGDPYDPSNVREFLVERLERPSRISFTSLQQLEEKKVQLISGVHSLRQNAQQQMDMPSQHRKSAI